MKDKGRPQPLAASLKARALELGFDACRVTSADPPGNGRQRLADWLAEGAHGDMEWMAGAEARRADPRALMPDAKSLVMLGLNYGPAVDPLEALQRKDRARFRSTPAAATTTAW